MKKSVFVAFLGAVMVGVALFATDASAKKIVRQGHIVTGKSVLYVRPVHIVSVITYFLVRKERINPKRGKANV